MAWLCIPLGVSCLIFGTAAPMGQLCLCCAPYLLALKYATFCVVGQFAGACCQPRDFAPHCLGWLRGAPAVMLVTFLPWPWGLFTEHCLLAMQEPDLWGSLGH